MHNRIAATETTTPSHSEQAPMKVDDDALDPSETPDTGGQSRPG